MNLAEAHADIFELIEEGFDVEGYLEVYKIKTRPGCPPAYEIAHFLDDQDVLIVICNAEDQSLVGAVHKVVTRAAKGDLEHRVAMARTGVVSMLFESGRGPSCCVEQWDSVGREWRVFGAPCLGGKEKER